MNQTPSPNVQVVRWTPPPTDGPLDENVGLDQMEPASPRHAGPGRTGFWQRTVTTGHEALASSSEAIALQIDQVADRMVTALERQHAERWVARDRTQQGDPLWQVSEVEISFGVQLTGEVTLAVFSGSSESSAQITLTLTRTNQTTP
jgi:hypothetical protein